MADNDNDLMPRRRRQPQQRAPFDIAFGDSIAVQQYHHGVSGTADNQYTRADQPLTPGATAGVGDPPSRVLTRLQQTLAAHPDYFKGKSVFLSPGTSNNPAELNEVGQILDTFKGLGDNAPKSVVVPGVGPGVRGSEAVNAALGKMVGDAGFNYYDPQDLRWADGIHPANALDMQAGAARTIEAPAAAAPAAAEPNQLAPTTPTPVQATFRPPYGNVVPYDASAAIKALGVTQQQWDTWRSYLAQRESAGYGQLPNGIRTSPVQLEGQTRPGYMGRYQMGTNEIVATARQLGVPVPSQQEFLGNPQLQEQFFEQYTLDHNNQLMSTPQYANADPQTRLAMLTGAHIGGVAGLRDYLETGHSRTDAYGTGVGNYVQSAYRAMGMTGPQSVAAPTEPAPAPSPYTAAPSGFESGLPTGPSVSETPYATTPAGSGYGTGLAADPNVNIARFAEPAGYTDLNPLWGHALDPGTMRVGGAVGNVVQQQQQAATEPGGLTALPYPGTQQTPQPSVVNEAGGPPGAAAGSQPPGQMTAQQMFALGMAQGFRGVPVTYDPWASLERFPQNRGRPSSYLGQLTPVSDPRIAVPRASYQPVSNPFFSVIRQPGRSGTGTEIAAQTASYGG